MHVSSDFRNPCLRAYVNSYEFRRIRVPCGFALYLWQTQSCRSPASCHADSVVKEFYAAICSSQIYRQLRLAMLLAPRSPLSPTRKKEKDPDSIGDRNVSGKVNFYSLEKEIALGKQLAQQVERQSKIINDPIIAEYVNRIGQNLVRNSDAKVPFTIKVIEDPTVNAFALPGGFFFVDSGLILKADTRSRTGRRDGA